jgi:hypothetical protein
MEDPMSTMITIPAPLVEHAREATVDLFGKAGLDIADQAELADRELAGPLARLDSFRALLEVLPTERGAAALVRLEHAPALCEALRDHAGSLNAVRQKARDKGHAELADECGAELAHLTAFTLALERQRRLVAVAAVDELRRGRSLPDEVPHSG